MFLETIAHPVALDLSRRTVTALSMRWIIDFDKQAWQCRRRNDQGQLIRPDLCRLRTAKPRLVVRASPPRKQESCGFSLDLVHLPACSAGLSHCIEL
jgi:hypothetical protein